MVSSRFTTNKWVGLYCGTTSGGQYGWTNTAMWDYLEKNKWGLWLETTFGCWYVDNAGKNNQAAAIANMQTQIEPYLRTINDNYTIPVRFDCKALTGNENTNPAYFPANFDTVLARYEGWCDGTLGDCGTGYWYEGSPRLLVPNKYLREHTTREIVAGVMGQWWLGDVNAWGTFFDYADIIDIETWWTTDAARSLPLINWIKANRPNKKIGIDTQINGGWGDIFHLWGTRHGSEGDSGPQPTYIQQRALCTTSINTIKAALNKQYFESETAEVAGDSGGISQAAHTAANGTVYPQGGWSTVQIMTEQLDFWDAQNWVQPIGDIMVYTYSWNFGDGATSTEVSPSHTYPAPGKYTVTLTVSDDVSTGSGTMEITVVKKAVTVTLTADKVQPKAGEAVKFTATVTG